MKLYLLIAVLAVVLVIVSVKFVMYVRNQNRLIDSASETIESILKGNSDARIECLEEGRIYRLFHDINSLATILGAHADNESKNKEFLKTTIQDISHQLKTPISALSIYNEVLQGDNLDEETIKRFNSLSEQELSRMENLVQNLLKIAKLDAMSIEMKKNPESLNGLVSDSIERFSYRAQSEGKSLRVEEKLSDSVVICDRGWMSEAFDNLIKNALDHTKEGDEIVVGWRPAGGKVCIEFRDTGSGIREEDIFYIFNRFYRSTTAQDKNGIGLGLPLVKSITESNGGSVEVESEFGKGTVFRLFLEAA